MQMRIVLLFGVHLYYQQANVANISISLGPRLGVLNTGKTGQLFTPGTL